MKSISRFLFLAVAALTLSACAGMELERAQKATPGNTELARSLYAGYVGLAKDEFDEGDYENSDAFARRAVAGPDVMPEDIAARQLPSDKVAELSQARDRLIKAIGAGGRANTPADAALAQVMFDCWMEEQEENFQPADIARCRDGFAAAMARVEAAIKPMPQPVAKKAEMAKPVVQPEAPSQLFFVYFDFNSVELNEQSRNVIASAAAAAKGANRVVVTGYADRSGSPAYNRALSKRRADAVAHGLQGAGVAAGMMTADAMGEERPMIRTEDGVKEAGNRLVRIQILR